MFKTTAILLTYGAIGGFAAWSLGTASTASLFLFGIVPILWLDRWCFRLSPWPRDEARRWELARRAAWFLAGMMAFRQLWLGNVTWHEALYLGAEITLATAFLEGVVRFSHVALRRCIASKDPKTIGWGDRWRDTLVVCALVGVLAPLGALHPPHSVAKRLPSVPGFAVETVSVPTADGLDLHGWLMSQPGARALLVFCHGHKGNCGQVVHFLKAAGPLGFNVSACDFRGHGESPGHTVAFGLHETQDVVAAVKFIRIAIRTSPCSLSVCLTARRSCSRRCRNFRMFRRFGSKGAFSSFDGVVDHVFHNVPEPFRDCITCFYSTMGWLDCGFHASDIRPIERLTEVRIPICFCHGRLDDLIPFEHAEALYRSYRGPKEYLWFDDGRHYGLRKDHEEEYFARFCRFLDERMPTPSPAACARSGSLITVAPPRR